MSDPFTDTRDSISLREGPSLPGPPLPEPRREDSHWGIVLGLVLVMALLATTLVVSLRSVWDLREDLRRHQQALASLERQVTVARDEVQAQRDAVVRLDDELRAALGGPDVEAIARHVRRSVFTIEAGERLGTAFVVESDGGTSLLLTNYHVIELAWESGSHEVRVQRGRQRLSGTILRVNANRDLAVVEVPASLPALAVDDRRPPVGAMVLVVGSPEGFEGTVTSGIVSAIRQRYVQFSAPVSPGSSGGPLVDGDGEVIGVTVAKVVSEAAEGLSFAIPIDVACRTVLEC